jgi:hypothetical protein
MGQIHTLKRQLGSLLQQPDSLEQNSPMSRIEALPKEIIEQILDFLNFDPRLVLA